MDINLAADILCGCSAVVGVGAILCTVWIVRATNEAIRQEKLLLSQKE